VTALNRHIAARIAATGPITLADYMATCLMHPEMGYYATRDPLGAAGDFTTAPEISQMFGELLGLCLAQTWLDQGRPAPFALAELGPGRGTLMADILRATKGVPGFHDGLRVHLVETSPPLREKQAQTVKHEHVTWHDAAKDLPDLPLFLMANEFFDALPIRQFQREGEGWRERVVGLRDERLTIGLGGPVKPPDLAHRLADTQDGDIVEICAPARAIAQEIGSRIEAHGGAALIVDYGDWRSLGDTFQAVKDHAPTNPLATPGEADLTAHVDFEALARAAACGHARLIPQGTLLFRLGIEARKEALARNLAGPARDSHLAAFQRLTGPEEMGRLFKVLALHPSPSQPPPGFDP